MCIRDSAGFALGLGAFSVYLFVLRAFYAHQDARTPCLVNVVENALNIALAFVLYDRFGVIGISASFAIAYTVSALWALQILSYKVPGFALRGTLTGILRIVLAAVVMAEAVWAVTQLMGDNAGAGAALRVVVGGVVGVGVYLSVLLILQAPEIEELRTRFRPSPPLPSGQATAGQ